MAPSKLDICNMALGYIGTRTIQQAEIEATPPGSPEATQCLLYWDRARRTVLRDCPYPFAIKRAVLTPENSVPAVYAGLWSQCYASPSGALKILSVHKGTSEEREPFAVEYPSSAELILCNAASAQVTYVADVETISLWDENFVAAIAMKLALLVSNALLKNNPEKIKELASLYEATLPKERWGSEGWAVTANPLRLNICNQALGLVGAKMITSQSENSPEAVQCNVYWDRARRSVLRDYAFPFAVRRAALVATTLPQVHGGKWTKAYMLPDNCIRILSVHDATDTETRQPYAVEYKDNTTVVLCDVTGAQITYVADVPDVALWDEKFVSAMACKLAMLICSALLGPEMEAKARKLEELSKLYAATLPGGILREDNWAVDANATRLGIYNMALGYVGANMVSSVTENSTEAVQCSLYWDRARRSVLRDYPYDFATRSVFLQPRAIPDQYRTEWEYCFTKPASALRVLAVHGADDRTNREEFALEHIGGEPLIFCNRADAYAVCVEDVEDVSLWDERFIEAVAYKLAFLICNTLIKDPKELPQKLEELTKLYAAALPGEKLTESNWSATSDNSRLNVCNMALGFVGVRSIGSLSESTKEAVQCTLFWDRARRAALRDFPYNFAQKRFWLTPKRVPCEYFGHWAFGYEIPDGVLKVNKIASRACCEPYRIPYVVEQIAGESTILTDECHAVALCTVDVPEVEKWDELFTMAMARKLAVLIAPALLGDVTSSTVRGRQVLMTELETLYRKAIPESEGADASERRDYREFDSWLAARWGYVERICRRKGHSAMEMLKDIHGKVCDCPIVTVNKYGAKGDGVTDDTAAINQCLRENPAAQIFFPHGIYRVTAPIKIYGGDGSQTLFLSKIVYDGPADERVPVLDVSMRKDAMETPTDDFDGGVTIIGGTVDCKRKAGIGIRHDAFFGRIMGVKVVDHTKCGILLGGEIDGATQANKSQQTLVSDCEIVQTSNADLSGVVGIALVHSDNNVDNCNILGCEAGLLLRTGGHHVCNTHVTPTDKAGLSAFSGCAVRIVPFHEGQNEGSQFANCYMNGTMKSIVNVPRTDANLSVRFCNCDFVLGGGDATEKNVYLIDGGHKTPIHINQCTIGHPQQVTFLGLFPWNGDRLDYNLTTLGDVVSNAPRKPYSFEIFNQIPRYNVLAGMNDENTLAAGKARHVGYLLTYSDRIAGPVPLIWGVGDGFAEEIRLAINKSQHVPLWGSSPFSLLVDKASVTVQDQEVGMTYKYRKIYLYNPTENPSGAVWWAKGQRPDGLPIQLYMWHGDNTQDFTPTLSDYNIVGGADAA